MLKRQYPEYPVKMNPPLAGGSIHLLRIKDTGLEISTWPGMFGNNESSVVLYLPYDVILEIQYKPSSLDVAYCQIVYLAQSKKRLVFKFSVIDQASLHGDRHAQKRLNSYTKSVTEALQRSKLGNRAQSSLPSKSIKPPGAMKKVIYGFLLLIWGWVIVGTGAVVDSVFLLIFGTFWICISIGAVTVDHIRVYTGWNPVIKFVAYLVTFIITFIIFGTLITIFEVYNLI